VKSYEVGLKSDFWNNRARFNLAGYIMDRKDSQVDISSIQFVGASSFNNLVTINAPGTTKIRGIEADLTVNPLEGLTLNASYAYTYTKIPPVLITATDTSGASTSVYQNFYIVFTPRNAASGSIDYAVPIGGGDTKLKFHFDGNYSQATQAFDQFATKNDSSLIFNGRISLADIEAGGGRNLTLSLWGRNLFNEQYVFRRDPSNSLPAAPTSSVTMGSIANVLGDYGNFNAPRTYGVEASFKF
jgi:iron complex outermembrane receptor protein